MDLPDNELLMHLALSLKIQTSVLGSRINAGGNGRAVECSGKDYAQRLSGYELGIREPPLPVLLEYARLVNVYLDVLADDMLDLPEKYPTAGSTKALNAHPLNGTKEEAVE